MILDQTSAVVTGGCSGLGRAVVEAFHRLGAKVAILDKSAPDPDIAKLATTYLVDVTRPDQIELALGQIVEAQGCPRIVVNCAGHGEFSPVVGADGPMSREHFTRMIDINLVGTMDVLRLCASRMAQLEPIDGERGVIVNTSSIAAWDGVASEVAYSAAKAAIAGMTLPLARDLAEWRIRVNTIAPGLFQTPLLRDLPKVIEDDLLAQTPFPPRMGAPAEFAALAVHMVTNAMFNGETVRLDGALRMGFRHSR